MVAYVRRRLFRKLKGIIDDQMRIVCHALLENFKFVNKTEEVAFETSGAYQTSARKIELRNGFAFKKPPQYIAPDAVNTVSRRRSAINNIFCRAHVIHVDF